MDKKKKLPGVAIALIILLALRTIGQLAGAALSSGGAIIFVVLAAIYIAGIVGTVQRKKWAPMLIIAIAVIDAIFAVGLSDGSAATGAIVMDGILVTLAIYDKKHIEGKMKKSSGSGSRKA